MAGFGIQHPEILIACNAGVPTAERPSECFTPYAGRRPRNFHGNIHRERGPSTYPNVCYNHL